MPTPKPFLTAEWRDLAIVSYEVEAARVAAFCPPGIEADTRDGHAFVSLVAFDFANTRVKGIRWPGFVNFPEINLRAYVRHGEERGVVFIRELVPSRVIAWMARRLYNEPYVRAVMKSDVQREGGRVAVQHDFEIGGASHRLSLVAVDEPTTQPDDSLEHFFKEHDLGVGRDRKGELVRYRVEHPRWRTYPIESFAVEVDFGAVYGKAWADLSAKAPASVVLAEGSAIAVYPAE